MHTRFYCTQLFISYKCILFSLSLFLSLSITISLSHSSFYITFCHSLLQVYLCAVQPLVDFVVRGGRATVFACKKYGNYYIDLHSCNVYILITIMATVTARHIYSLSHVSIYPSIYSSIYLSIYPFIYLSICISIHISIHPSIYSTIHPSIIFFYYYLLSPSFDSLPSHYPSLFLSFLVPTFYPSLSPFSSLFFLHILFILLFHLFSLHFFSLICFLLSFYLYLLYIRFLPFSPPILLIFLS